MEGSSLNLEVMQKVPELVVHERMSQGRGVKGRKEMKKVPGWSFEEMKDKPNIAVVVDTEKMRKWRGSSQSEMDPGWKNMAGRMEEEGSPGKIQGRRKQKRGLQRKGCTPGMEEGAQKQEIQSKKVGIRIFLCLREYNLQRLQCKQEETKQQQRMVIMKDLTKKIRSKGRMDAKKQMVGF